MNTYSKIDISGINLDIIDILQNQYNKNVEIIHKNSDDSIQLQIPKTLHDDSLLVALNDFLENLKNSTVHQLSPSWIFDQKNAVVIGPLRKFYLTHKEVLFLRMLLNSDKIVTYKEMLTILWQGKSDVSSNAMRVFIKNLKKKLPLNVLKNFQDIGYKLVL